MSRTYNYNAVEDAFSIIFAIGQLMETVFSTFMK